MFDLRKEITVEAPPEAVFRFLDDPRNHVKITPGLVSVDGVEWLENGGKRATYNYMLAGVQLTGEIRDQHREPPGRLVQELSGAIDGTIEYVLESGDGVTTVTYHAEYDLPDTVIDTVLAPVAQAYNEREADATLKNLKSHLEA